MGKLGYTFYPKDWRTDDDVFDLSLAEKGFFRELIDECFMQNSQNIYIKPTTFCRKHGINRRTFTKLLQNLSETSLIVLLNNDGSEIQIPSVGKRLGIKERSSNGGKKSKAVGNNNAKKTNSKSTNIKENRNRIEIETKKEIPTVEEFLEYAKEKTGVAYERLEPSIILKYESWKVAEWKTGGDKPRKIKNWKSTLLNTIPHLKATPTQGKTTKLDGVIESWKN